MAVEPTNAELTLINAAREGRVADYTSSLDRTIRAEIISQLLTGNNPSWEVHYRGVNIRGAQIADQLYLGGATLKFRLALIDCCIEEGLNLADASAVSISLAGSYLRGGIQAERLNVRGSLFLDRVTAKGEVKLLGATISGQLKCRGAHFWGESGPALNADGVTVAGGIFLDEGFTADGEVRLQRARVESELNCRGGRFQNPKGAALVADGASVTGGVFLDRAFDAHDRPVGTPFMATGEVRILHSQITGQFSCSGGMFENPMGQALTADGAVVSGEFLLNRDFTAVGAVTAMGAEIFGDLVCTGGRFDALILERAKVEGTLFLNDLRGDKPKSIDLAHATVGQLSDDEPSWPAAGRLHLVGFEYQAFGPGAPNDASHRLKWLQLAYEHKLSTQPYEQLEKVLRSAGDETGARTAYIEKRRTIRKTGNLGAAARAGDWFLDWSIRYGYQTWRAFFWALLIVTIGAFLFCSWFWGMETPVTAASVAVASARAEKSRETTPPRNVGSAQSGRRFLVGLDHFLYSFSYSLDVFLPFGDLHLKSAQPLQPRKPQDWWFYIFEVWYIVEMISGWIIAGLIAAAVTGITRK
jgi:hypothetical protein